MATRSRPAASCADTRLLVVLISRYRRRDSSGWTEPRSDDRLKPMRCEPDEAPAPLPLPPPPLCERMDRARFLQDRTCEFLFCFLCLICVFWDRISRVYRRVSSSKRPT